MPIKIKKHWEDLDTFEVEVIDALGDVFMFNGKPWKMVLRSPGSERVQEVVKKNAADEAAWRSRQPASRRVDPLPEKMALRHSHRLIGAAHSAWINPPIEGDDKVDFDGEEFFAFLEEEPWYFAQWQRAWLDVKNSKRPTESGRPKTTSSSGAKSK